MTSIAQRVQQIDWSQISENLANHGHALTPVLLKPEECDDLVHSYDDDRNFRSHVIMARFGFGKGEYKYFKYPLPRLVSDLRNQFYPQLAAVANSWENHGDGEIYPTKYSEFLDLCHSAGQTKPTPLLLRYEVGDFNCLHQDLYGELAFPLQLTFFLSERGRDYSGGECVLVEQRPRMQSRAEVIPAEQGQAVIFPTRYRFVTGKRGPYKINVRHGVSPVRSGKRFTLGVIFHDAK